MTTSSTRISTSEGPAGPAEPPHPCPLCPRLHAFVTAQAALHPDWHNGPVPSFGDAGARLVVVGLAPGLRGANRTGRPFTGDHAGGLLYETLAAFGFAQGRYEARPDDGVRLEDALITNAVRCVPPQNKPTGPEIATCNRFLAGTLRGLPSARVVLALGRISHEAVLRALGLRLAAYPFAHHGVHRLPGGPVLVDSYHCSRYNTNTGRLTQAMFEDVFRTIAGLLGRPVPPA